MPLGALAAEAPPPCGVGTERATLATSQTDNTIDLGRSTTGAREWDVVFAWEGACTLCQVTPRLRTLQGSASSVDTSGIALATEIGEQRLVVTLTIPRDEIPPGRFTGNLEISGSGIAGLGVAAITIRHQEPVTIGRMSILDQVFWVAAAAVVCIVLVLDLRSSRANRSLLYAPLVVVALVGIYPLAARLRDGSVPALWWPIWLGAAGLVGGFVIAALKYASTGVELQGGVRLGAAMALSFGAGLTAWRSQYLNTPDWALTFESAFALIAVVGAATITSALLLLQPAQPTPGPGDQTGKPSASR